MRFNSSLTLSIVFCVTALAGCAATSPRSSEPQAPARHAGSADQAKVAISSLAVSEYERALAAMNAKRDTQAERILHAMTQTYDDLAGPHVNLGIIYHRNGRNREAEQTFRKAIEINPNRPDSHNHLGIVLRERGRFQEAHDAYLRALELDRSYAYAHLNLGILYDLYLLDSRKALQHYQRYQKLTTGPDPQVVKWIVDLKRRMKRRKANVR
ncbi:MAG: tetratricopeptide repeat protein [Acidiferrobacterales bacterium]